MSDFDFYGCDGEIAYCCKNPVHPVQNDTARYFAQYLIQDLFSVFKWKLPQEWNKDYFLYNLYLRGFVGVVNTPAFGTIVQAGSIEGRDLYYQPKTFRVVNPAISGDVVRTIGADCTIIKLQQNYMGVCDLLKFYITKLSLLAEAVDMNITNSKLAYVFSADNKAAAESFKKMFDKINSGEPAVYVDKNLFNDDGSPRWNVFTNNLSQNYITPDLLSDMRKIREMFLTEIGIPNANTDKRERLIDSEVNANNVETRTLGELWLENLKECCDRANKMFGLNLSVEWREEKNNGNADNNEPVQ